MGVDKGVKAGLEQNSTTAQGLSDLYSKNAQGVSSTLTPALTAEAIHPEGYTPTQLGAQTTAAEQTAGGANAGATGGALLRASRTRNSGAAPAAIDEANRQGSQELSQTNAKIQTNNANLQKNQQQEGLSGLEGLYGENVNAGNQALGISTNALNDTSNLKNFWGGLLYPGGQNS
jgi:hypothetical protein